MVGSARPHAVQEQFDGSLSPLLLNLWTGRDAVVFVGIPEHQTEEEVGRNCGVLDLDLAAVGKLLKQTCDGPNPTQPTLLVCERCQFRKLNDLHRKSSTQHDHLRCPGVGEH